MLVVRPTPRRIATDDNAPVYQPVAAADRSHLRATPIPDSGDGQLGARLRYEVGRDHEGE